MRNSLVLGAVLGEGIARRVYTWLPDVTLVAKMQMRESYEERDYQNVAEWQLWANASEDLRKWLAPCEWISPCGTLLLQRACGRIAKRLIPKKVPQILADCHDENWGSIDGKPILMDYGRHWAVEMASNAQAMKKLVAVDSDGTSLLAAS